MKVIYIAGKYRGPTAWAIEQNIRAAEDVAALVLSLGMMPLCPHTNTAHMEGIVSDEIILEGTLELLRRCDAVVLVPGWEKSTGTRSEIAEAEALCKPVFGLDTGCDFDRSVPLYAAAYAKNISDTIVALRRWAYGTVSP